MLTSGGCNFKELLGEVEGWGPNPTEWVRSEVTQSVVSSYLSTNNIVPFTLKKKKSFYALSLAI